MGFTYSFFKVYEMDFVDCVFTCVAKSMSEAKQKFMQNGFSLADMDAMQINGEWV